MAAAQHNRQVDGRIGHMVHKAGKGAAPANDTSYPPRRSEAQTPDAVLRLRAHFQPYMLRQEVKERRLFQDVQRRPICTHVGTQSLDCEQFFRKDAVDAQPTTIGRQRTKSAGCVSSVRQRSLHFMLGAAPLRAAQQRLAFAVILHELQLLKSSLPVGLPILRTSPPSTSLDQATEPSCLTTLRNLRDAKLSRAAPLSSLSFQSYDAGTSSKMSGPWVFKRSKFGAIPRNSITLKPDHTAVVSTKAGAALPPDVRRLWEEEMPKWSSALEKRLASLRLAEQSATAGSFPDRVASWSSGIMAVMTLVGVRVDSSHVVASDAPDALCTLGEAKTEEGSRLAKQERVQRLQELGLRKTTSAISALSPIRCQS